MEFGFFEEREFGPRHHLLAPPPLLSSSSFSSNQAMQASYIHGEGSMGPRQSLEELERELLEESIKEEILARKISQRRMIEEQARRDMENERAMMMERLQADWFHQPLLIVPPEDRFGDYLHTRQHEFDQQLPLVPMKSEVKTINETRLPSHKFSGTKRKFVPTMLETSGIKISRSVRKDWSCALCQLSITNEVDFNNHLKGKKHLEKAVQLGCSEKVAEPPSVWNRIGPCNSSPTPKLTAQQKKGRGGKKVAILVNGKRYEVIERGIFLWCMLCNTKCNSKDSLAAHFRGKKHLSRELKGKITVGGEEGGREASVEKGEHMKEAEQLILNTDGESNE